MTIESIVYSTKNYAKKRKCNDSIISCYTDNEEIFGVILAFERNLIKIEKLSVTKVSDNFYFFTQTSDILKISINSEFKKCQIFSVEKSNYLSVLHYYLLVD